MTVAIETTCRRRGLWRLCPPCRDGPDAAGILSHEHPAQSLTGPHTASELSR